MIPPVLATQALAIITPLLIKGAEALTQGIGKDIWEGIKGLFKKNKKDEVIKKLEAAPKDEEVKQEVQFELASLLKEDAAAKEQLERLVTTYNNSRQTITQNISGTGNITAGGNISGNTITTNNK